ncbi:MAG: RagB/SusD family nutrient uptake outer membrane protein [Bacteroides sp.]|nr:RagB/SusD family nutrient uptake outer membrane protein [Bacteroides sp.]
MKKLIYFAVLGMLTFSSCEDFLNRTPVSDLSPENYFMDLAERANWNAGIYDAFQSALGKNQVLYGDVRSDNVHTTGYATSWLYMNAITPQQGDCSWKNFYECISRCNVGIEKYPTIPNATELGNAPYLGQCYGMRAYMYFWGTRTWGKMPLITSTWDGELTTFNIPRASLDEVKAQILSDIDEAIRLFRLSDSGSKYYINLATMYALKTDVHMWYNEYEKALEASDFFIDNKDFALAADETEWKNIFLKPADSKEVMFAMSWSYENNGANGGWPGQLGASNTNNGFKMSLAIFNEFLERLRSDDGFDARLWNTVDTVKLFWESNRLPITIASYGNGGMNKCIKYSDVDPAREYSSEDQIYKSYFKVLNSTDAEHQLIMYRMANIMLLRAEALNKLGRGEEALDIVNDIRSRVGYTKDAKTEVSSFSNKDAIESIILLERQLELFGEGCRWFDLIRTGHLFEVMDPVYSARQEAAGVTVTGMGDEGTKYWPVYYREFESNLALHGDQNPPYTER